MRLFKKGLTAIELLAAVDLTGKWYLLTGCNSGLGLETMRALCARGATVLGTARTLEKAQAACSSVEGLTVPIMCELSDPKSIRRVIETVDQPLDGIIANAGIMALPDLNVFHGIEAQMFVNHMAHFILVTGLLDRLTPRGRVVMVASGAHAMARSGIKLDDLGWTRPYKPWAAYGQSKLANILFSNELARRLPDGQTSNALHPGLVDTGLWRHLTETEILKITRNAQLQPAAECAASTCFLAAHPDAEKMNGAYVSNGSLGSPSATAQDENLAGELWDVSARILAEL